MQEPFLSNLFYFIERRIFAPKDKFSNKIDHLPAWRDFKKKIAVYVDKVSETSSQKFIHIPFCASKRWFDFSYSVC